ncbi:MAG: NUDIX hydrolase [bacterium]|nr:NUDIX hydrolase [bacterium]
MKMIFINDNNLEIDDLDYEVIRVKGVIINNNNEVLVAHNNNTYQLIGGHVEDGEDMEEALLREVKEETGIDVDSVSGPFMQIMTYAKNYFNSGKNVCNKIYYYRIVSNDLPNLLETNYDELESQTDFGLFYVKLEDFKRFLRDGIKDKTIDENIGRELLLVFDEYNKLYGE